MSISFEELRTLLNSLETNKLKVYRDAAPSSAKYPYIIYEFVDEKYKRASSKVLADMPLYQISYVTDGIETELSTLKKVLNENKVAYSSFTADPYDENDSDITQFNTYVRCING